MERRRKETSNIWPRPADHFRSKSEKFPTFDLLTVSLPAVGNVSFPLSVVSAYDEIHLKVRTEKGGESGGRPQHPVKRKGQEKTGKRPPESRLEVVVEAHPPASGISKSAATASAPDNGNPPKIETLAAGTQTKLALVDRLSASRSRPGDSFKAILAEPLRLSSGEIIPEGTLFEGRVGRSTPRDG